ncbi:uncharacterized protein BcabD6B2_07270 [Babesia caballi]|uniref:Uncharacterized protein n=1 Tax=Babesia caballi TaxID=5871 RepID=A0AAV4LNA3_BABCB|nr:hypothetical protein BcabD6B2_07270 [Babesia caballi]
MVPPPPQSSTVDSCGTICGRQTKVRELDVALVLENVAGLQVAVVDAALGQRLHVVEALEDLVGPGEGELLGDGRVQLDVVVQVAVVAELQNGGQHVVAHLEAGLHVDDVLVGAAGLVDVNLVLDAHHDLLALDGVHLVREDVELGGLHGEGDGVQHLPDLGEAALPEHVQQPVAALEGRKPGPLGVALGPVALQLLEKGEPAVVELLLELHQLVVDVEDLLEHELVELAAAGPGPQRADAALEHLHELDLGEGAGGVERAVAEGLLAGGDDGAVGVGLVQPVEGLGQGAVAEDSGALGEEELVELGEQGAVALELAALLHLVVDPPVDAAGGGEPAGGLEVAGAGGVDSKRGGDWSAGVRFERLGGPGRRAALVGGGWAGSLGDPGRRRHHLAAQLGGYGSADRYRLRRPALGVAGDGLEGTRQKHAAAVGSRVPGERGAENAPGGGGGGARQLPAAVPVGQVDGVADARAGDQLAAAGVVVLGEPRSDLGELARVAVLAGGAGLGGGGRGVALAHAVGALGPADQVGSGDLGHALGGVDLPVAAGGVAGGAGDGVLGVGGGERAAVAAQAPEDVLALLLVVQAEVVQLALLVLVVLARPVRLGDEVAPAVEPLLRDQLALVHLALALLRLGEDLEEVARGRGDPPLDLVASLAALAEEVVVAGKGVAERLGVGGAGADPVLDDGAVGGRRWVIRGVAPEGHEVEQGLVAPEALLGVPRERGVLAAAELRLVELEEAVVDGVALPLLGEEVVAPALGGVRRENGVLLVARRVDVAGGAADGPADPPLHLGVEPLEDPAVAVGAGRAAEGHQGPAGRLHELGEEGVDHGGEGGVVVGVALLVRVLLRDCELLALVLDVEEDEGAVCGAVVPFGRHAADVVGVGIWRLGVVWERVGGDWEL